MTIVTVIIPSSTGTTSKTQVPSAIMHPGQSDHSQSGMSLVMAALQKGHCGARSGRLHTALAQGMHILCLQDCTSTSTSASMQMWHSVSGGSSFRLELAAMSCTHPTLSALTLPGTFTSLMIPPHISCYPCTTICVIWSHCPH